MAACHAPLACHAVASGPGESSCAGRLPLAPGPTLGLGTSVQDLSAQERAQPLCSNVSVYKWAQVRVSPAAARTQLCYSRTRTQAPV